MPAPTDRTLRGKTLLITGASRGIGRAIAVRAARDGANVAILAKTTTEHVKLPGTIHDAAAEIEQAGGQALACKCDIRDDEQVQAAVDATTKAFGGIDIVVNNASAISLTGLLETPMKMYDRMFDINARGSFLVTQCAMPHLLKAGNAHVLNLSPPLTMHPRWFAGHAAYTLAKYAMSAWVLGMTEEFRDRGVAFNALWPRTGHRHRGGAEPAGRRKDGQCQPHARDRGRRRLVRADPRKSGLHGPFLYRRRGSGRRRTD
jgi:citronellol/citronellal dehydrogenase